MLLLQRKLTPALLTPALLVWVSAFLAPATHAATKVGSQYYDQQFDASENVTIFTKAQNTKGIRLDTVVVDCYQNAELDAVSPGGNHEQIAFCASRSDGYGVSQLGGILLPAGWGLAFSTGVSNGNPDKNVLAITYDLLR